MIFIILIKLYTTRILLNILGVTDYGIYNLVAGIIVLFSFINSTMNSTNQRFFCTAIGLDNKGLLKDYFINAINVQFLIGIITIILAESLGLYLLYYKLQIPPNRFDAAIFTYHIAVITCFFNIIRTPYNAIIIAFEKMSFFAYMSILEAAASLVIIYILPHVAYDQLNTYSILILLITGAITAVYVLYCTIKYKECRLHISFSISKTKEMFSFSIWSMLSSLANIGSKQSLNIFFNIFNGVTLNSSLGITNQLSSAIYGFIQNFQVATNPQLIKSYANNDWRYLEKLFYSASKISYYLIIILAIPFILCINEVLELWLKQIPEYTPQLCILTILGLIVNAIGGPVWTVIQATGNIKRYQMYISIATLINIPIFYLILYIGISPDKTLITPIITNIIIVIIGLYMMSKHITMHISDYWETVLWPCLKVSSIGIVPPMVSAYMLRSYDTHIILYIITIVCISSFSIISAIYVVGLNSAEKSLIKEKIKSLI